MNVSVDIIPLNRLALALIPVLVVILVQQRWQLPVRPTIYGAARMVAQLLLVGYGIKTLGMIFKLNLTMD